MSKTYKVIFRDLKTDLIIREFDDVSEFNEGFLEMVRIVSGKSTFLFKPKDTEYIEVFEDKLAQNKG